jgi:hypothetical protein
LTAPALGVELSAGWDIASLEPATVRGEPGGAQAEMAFWYLRAQRRYVS